jgi:hypothetical protein
MPWQKRYSRLNSARPDTLAVLRRHRCGGDQAASVSCRHAANRGTVAVSDQLIKSPERFVEPAR